MRKYYILIFLLLPTLCMAQGNDPTSHRGVQFATAGTDFWVCFPRTLRGMLPNYSRLYVVSERDCIVTVRNERIDYTQIVPIQGRYMCGPDTNYIQIPIQYTRINDTIPYIRLPNSHPIDIGCGPYEPRHDYSGILGDLPQARGFHVTSTDTISLYVVVASNFMSACTVIPTEMLRDEYIAQPPISNHHKHRTGKPSIPNYMPGISSIDIVATEDSTVVDVILSDWDWLNRRPGDTLTVMLRRGELYHISAGEAHDKYYPLLAPHYDMINDDPSVVPVPVQRHTFEGDTVMRDTFAVDLAGTRIKARDCKRIAVFESSGIGGSGVRGGTRVSNMFLEQSIPPYFAGKEYLVPSGTGKYIRMTSLDQDATVTISDPAHPASGTRTLTIASGQTDWWEGVDGEGPYYITSDNPILLKWIDSDLCTMTSTDWWHGGRIAYGGITNVMPINNVTPMPSQLHIFTRTENAQSIYVDSYPAAQYFHPIEGTPYSYAYFDANSSFTSLRTHHILSRGSHPYMAFFQTGGAVELQHVQPGKRSFLVNGLPADSLNADSIWCMYDPVVFEAKNQHPFDSLFWDFGDGTTLQYSYTDNEVNQPQSHLFQDTGRLTVQAIFQYEDEGCFTRKSDTLSTTLIIHSHHDTTITVRLCEGSYFFRDNELDYTDTHYFTTYWTPSGCDTLWAIDLVTCPHCHWAYDTVAPDDLPVTYNGLSFGSECHDEPIYIHINDSCDSIIYYTLIVIPNWGEKPIDSTWIIAPNVITPALESNNLFSLHCSPHIIKAEATIFDRRGTRLAQFDGLTGHWDGTANGNPCPQGTYVYYVRYIDTHDEGWKTLTGTVTLLR